MFRAVQIVSGAISLILSTLLIVIGFPVIAAGSISTAFNHIIHYWNWICSYRYYVFEIIFYFTTTNNNNINKNQQDEARKLLLFTNIGLGALAIVFAIIAMILSNHVSAVPLTLFSIAISVMFNGIARIMQSAWPESSKMA